MERTPTMSITNQLPSVVDLFARLKTATYTGRGNCHDLLIDWSQFTNLWIDYQEKEKVEKYHSHCQDKIHNDDKNDIDIVDGDGGDNGDDECEYSEHSTRKSKNGNDYACKICDMTFGYGYHLTRHMVRDKTIILFGFCK